jgi:hypothetical protein
LDTSQGWIHLKVGYISRLEIFLSQRYFRVGDISRSEIF